MSNGKEPYLGDNPNLMSRSDLKTRDILGVGTGWENLENANLISRYRRHPGSLGGRGQDEDHPLYDWENKNRRNVEGFWNQVTGKGLHESLIRHSKMAAETGQEGYGNYRLWETPDAAWETIKAMGIEKDVKSLLASGSKTARTDFKRLINAVMANERGFLADKYVMPDKRATGDATEIRRPKVEDMLIDEMSKDESLY